MENSINSASPRLHPLVVAAAASVAVVSLLGAAAITGIFPSHSHAMPPTIAAVSPAQINSFGDPGVTQQQPPLVTPVQATPTRFQTADGRVFEEVPSHASPRIVEQITPVNAVDVQRPAHHVAHHKVTHHYTQNTAYQPAYIQEQPYYAPHPVRNYVSDMNPVGTGMGAVVGGLLGNQVGGGNGKKLATVAGVLLGGYVGNEVAHDRNPIPFGNR